MVSDVPEPPVRAQPLGQDRLGAPAADHDAEFAAFYKAFVPTLVGFLCWQGAPTRDAADIAQETMGQLYRHWSTVQIASAWCRRVAARRWARRIADTDHEQLVDDIDLQLGDYHPLITGDAVLAFEQRHDVLRVLDALPPRQRQILAWTYDGYTPAEIAEELGLTSANVRGNLRKARRAAADFLAKDAR